MVRRCEFASSVAAVRAALDVQWALAKRNAGLSEEPRAEPEDMNDDDPFSALGRFIADLDFDRLPADVVARSRLVMLDTIGAIASGRRSPEAQAIDAWASRDGASSVLSALAAGTAGVVDELDEGHSGARGHPGIHIVPAAVTEAARLGRSGADLVTALVTGYEVAARLGAATTLRPGTHPHGTWGTCGAAAAVARLLHLDATQAADALRFAACMQLATCYDVLPEGSPVRHLWSGIANLTGTAAAHMAQAGLPAPSRAPASIFASIVGTEFDGAAATRGLGVVWEIANSYFKLYACCRHAHAAVDAARQALGPGRLACEAVSAIRVRTYRQAVQAICPEHYPTQPLAARFSLPYVLAALMVYGDLPPEAFGADALADPRIAALVARVSVVEDERLSAAAPASRGAEVEIDLADGGRLAGAVVHSRGDPSDPIAPAEVEAKFMRLAAPLMGETAARRLRQQVAKLDSLTRVDDIAAALRCGMRQ
jgi:2-methylcitrate dehydratase PrpD